MDSTQSVLVAVVLALVGGGGGVKLIEFTVDRWKGRAERRRAEVDRAAKVAAEAHAAQAAAERRARLLTESLHDHRNAMLKSGQWSRDSLPPFIKE